MEFINCVRVRVKDGRVDQFVALNQDFKKGVGQSKSYLVNTGNRTFCWVGVWDSEQALVEARDEMISNLDSVRHCLEDLRNGLGVTDPVSGLVTLSID